VSATSTSRQTRRPRADGERSRQTILKAAAGLATVEGLDGLSIGHLAEHIGMSKSGLYAHFGSKEELQLATVQTALEIFNADVIEPAEATTGPLEHLEAICDRFLSHVERRVFPGGCFFASVSAEFDTHPGPVKDKIASVQQQWTANLEQLVRQAQSAGRLNPTENPVQLAFEINAYLLMGNTAFVLHNDPAYLHQARAAIRNRLSHAR
jgi:AcrR family transcriptional regulator